MECNIQSKYYTKWNDYKEQFPIVADIEEARTIQNYEDAMMVFIFRLFY
ncbi:hypothetical protein [Desulfosporosinus fructosivorans]|nr:hypothetical protein [Desulfosporosinus fructosivorans]